MKHHILVKTDHWDVTEPGFTEVDLVSHSGDRADGDFLHTLNLTDIQTAWVEHGAVMGKSQVRVQERLDHLRAALPFALRGIDSDNGLPRESSRQSFSNLTMSQQETRARIAKRFPPTRNHTLTIVTQGQTAIGLP